MSLHLPRLHRVSHWLPLLLLAFSAAAIAQVDPPARVATITHAEGSVAFAPAGETEWATAVVNRPITRGDRLWTDPGGRAEVHLGSATLHMDSQTFAEVVALDDEVLQLNLNEGVVNARVRQLVGGDNFEITTPQLAFRAAQPGDYRLDVDAARGTTRVTVRSGVAMIYGAGAGRLQLQGGQQMAFSGRDLAPIYGQPTPLEDGFDRWAGERNRNEDRSVSARYLPRDVVGYHELDAHGSWAVDPNYGAVWYPRVLAADWAPYRYGRWDWIPPWGWTWIDDAPWGFAPFHYGRWAVIEARWCWVPGRIGPRPVYSPALVAFAGSGNFDLSLGSGPGIAWFPLAPGEPWRPTYRSSSRYLRSVNRNMVLANPDSGHYFHQRRPDAITAVRVDDFSHGRPVHRHWNRLNPAELARVPIQAQPVMPTPRRWSDSQRSEHQRPQPGPAAVMPAIIARPQPPIQLQPRVAVPPPRAEEIRPEFRRRGHGSPAVESPQRQERAREEQRHQARQLQDRGRRDQQAQQGREQQRLQQAQGRQHGQEQRAARQQPAPSAAMGSAPAPRLVQPAAAPRRDEGRGRAQRQQHEQAVQAQGDGRSRGRGHPVN